MSYNIKKTKDVLSLLVRGTRISLQAKVNDGTYKSGDISMFFIQLPSILSLCDNISDIPQGIKDINDEDLEDLKSIITKSL